MSKCMMIYHYIFSQSPPQLSGGGIDFAAWKQRLQRKGIIGDIDAVIERASFDDVDALAARGELRAFERLADAGYQVEIQKPEERPDIPQGIKTPEARIIKDGVAKKLEVKTAVQPPVRQTVNDKINKANRQIKQGGGRGIIVVDFSKVLLKHGKKYLSNQVDIAAFLRGKLTGDTERGRLRSIDQIEIIYRDAIDGILKRTHISRDANGIAQKPITERME